MNMNRRHLLKCLALSTGAAITRPPLIFAVEKGVTTRGLGGISLNYDDSHFFCWHPVEEMNAAGVDAEVDRYRGTQVDHLFFCPNAQRSSVASKARQSLWDGYDPDGDNNQPFLAGVPDRRYPWSGGPNQRQHMRNLAHAAWLLHTRGIDPYARWIARSRKYGIHPWLSMRMNDVHYAGNPEHSLHDRFWKEHPEYRRDPQGDNYNGQCLDYGRPEVRTYQMAYVRELIFRYDMDGFEFDWMRNPFYFKPGQEKKGLEILTEFTSEVRQLLDEREKEVGHRIQLSARVPARPETALGLGFDVPAWASRNLIDRLVVTPFLFSQFDIPIEQWKQLLAGSSITLEAGLMQTIRPFAGGPTLSHSLETARGAAMSFLDRGADRIYLFNFFDYEPYGVTGEAYRESVIGKAFNQLLREIGSMKTMAGRSRRHIVTNLVDQFSDDTSAPRQDPLLFMPRDISSGAKVWFRIPVGPAPVSGQAVQVRLAAQQPQTTTIKEWDIRVNGQSCRSLGQIVLPAGTPAPTHAFEISPRVVRHGTNEVDIVNPTDASARLIWLELAFSGPRGKWPVSSLEVSQLHPQ